jgi:preprotein translocase subunit YajC
MTNLPSWFQTPDLMQLLIVLLFSAFIWFAIRTLQHIDRNQKELFNRLTTLEREFYTLKGEHAAIHGRRREDQQ